jgi:integrase
VAQLVTPRRREQRAIDLHLHDLRHEAASHLLEAGWPLHEVRQTIGHANIRQTSTYLNATPKGLYRSMKMLDRTRRVASGIPRSRRAPRNPVTYCRNPA